MPVAPEIRGPRRGPGGALRAPEGPPEGPRRGPRFLATSKSDFADFDGFVLVFADFDGF